MTFWKREIEVRYSGITLSAPKIQLDIKFDLENPTAGTVKVYNINKDTEKALNEVGKPIVVEAGYENQRGVIINGSVQRIEKFRERLERVVKFNITNGAIGLEKLGGLFNQSYLGREQVVVIVQDIVKTGLKLPLGSLEPIPESLVVIDWSYNGKATGALLNLLRPFKISFYEDSDGTIQFNRAASVSGQASKHKISMRNGLIESPSETEEGVRIKSLMNANYKLEDTIEVESEFVNGIYKIVSVQHVGDNWDGKFFTEMDTRPVEQES